MRITLLIERYTPADTEYEIFLEGFSASNVKVQAFNVVGKGLIPLKQEEVNEMLEVSLRQKSNSSIITCKVKQFVKTPIKVILELESKVKVPEKPKELPEQPREEEEKRRPIGLIIIGLLIGALILKKLRVKT